MIEVKSGRGAISGMQEPTLDQPLLQDVSRYDAYSSTIGCLRRASMHALCDWKWKRLGEGSLPEGLASEISFYQSGRVHGLELTYPMQGRVEK
jgi:hypothetical protein